MADQIEELIREIAAKHGLAVSRDDPILVLQTINSRLMQDSAAAHQVQLDRFKEELELLSQRWSDEARQKAERILNAALSASAIAIATTELMKAGTDAALAAVRADVDALLAKIACPVRDAHQIAIINIAASAFALLAAVIALFAVVLH